MRIVFDISTPKEVTFFNPIINKLKVKGCAVSVVTRDYQELNLLIKNFGINATVFGKHGGPSLLEKLKSSSERVGLLADYFDSITPNVLVTFSNPESSRAAYGLKIPIVCFDDVPEAEAVSKLTLPLASKVCAPWIIPKGEFMKYGVLPEKLFYYEALDPMIWLQNYKVDNAYLNKLKTDPEKPLVVCRETEWQSAYVSSDLVGRVVVEIKNKHPDWQIINIPRYSRHPFYDTPSLLSNADLFIGGGGTMCIEAAYYGTPVISTRTIDCHYMNWLFEKGLAIGSFTVPNTLEKAEEIICRRKKLKEETTKKARRIFKDMKFPLDEISKLISDSARK